MNKCVEIGRLTKDPETKILAGDNSVTRFTLAVQRRGKKDVADFIPCVAFGKTGEIISTHCKKGAKIGVNGHLQSGSYKAQDGTTKYTLDLIVDEFEFCDNKRD